MKNIINLKKLYFFITLIGCIFLINSAHANQGLKWVEAQGNGIIETSVADAKKRAIQNAQRNAVEKALGVMLSSETVVEDFAVLQDKILTRVQGYVKRQVVLSHSCQQGNCTALIKAQVEETKLANDVAALAHILPQMNYPTLVVAIAQKSFTQNLQKVSLDMATVNNVISRALADKGFDIVEASALEAEKLRQSNLMDATGNTLGQALEMASHLAQVMIVGQSVVQDNGGSPYNERVHSYSAMLSAKAYETGTGKLLASASAQGVAPHHSFAIGTQNALQKASKILSDRLSKQIVEKWLDNCYNNHNVELIVEKIPYGAVNKLRAAISEKIKDAKSVNKKHYVRGRAQLLVGWLGCNIQPLADKLDGLRVGKSGNLEVLEVLGNTVRVNYVK